jgi:tetratricopeptide (TPR) repeat protein
MLTACTTLPHETTALPKARIQAPTESTLPSAQKNDLARRQARQLLEKQDYIGAINLIQAEIRKGLDEQVMGEEYLQAANSSLGQADTFLKQGRYPKAALIFKTVQESYPQSLGLQKQVTASPMQLANKLNLCTEKLMEEGLVAYRSGEFAIAIVVWEQVLEFNPQHQAAQNSIQTTQLQISNLKSLDNKQ